MSRRRAIGTPARSRRIKVKRELIIITNKQLAEIYAHAKAVYPEEACGLIAGEKADDGTARIKKVYFLTNIDHAEDHFSMDPKEQLGAIKAMREEGYIQLGNWHSHPASPSRPSEEDIKLAYDSGASYLILSLLQEAHPVLNAYHIEQDKHLVEYERLEVEVASDVSRSLPTLVAVNEYPSGWDKGGNYDPDKKV